MTPGVMTVVGPGTRTVMKAMPARHMLTLAAVLAVLPAGVACAHHHGQGADAPASAGGPAVASSGSRLVVTTDNGLRLRPTDGHRVTVDDGVKANWSHRGHTWVLDLTCADGSGKDGGCPRMPSVRVPDGMDVTARARNAGVDVAGIAAALDITTVNGDVAATDSGRGDGAVRLSTRNGSVRTTALEAGRLVATTTNGDVVAACADAPPHVTATTTNGSVDVTVADDAPAYAVTASTVNGRTTVTVPTRDASRGPAMTLTTVNGDVAARRE
ncbi:DUF4097 family beta strand repeat-containing protein [Streptomyces sp. NPDC050523]|uniref:DUF4097 family beta strand repeat-containing protein n=1 Tax=Streptomyces sp. NPDC050523 TaxID=3365622 RepID=UPI0037BE0036